MELTDAYLKTAPRKKLIEIIRQLEETNKNFQDSGDVLTAKTFHLQARINELEKKYVNPKS